MVKFVFKVTSPLNFTDNNGSWTLSNQELTINTKIPLGPLSMTHVRVNKLTTMSFRCWQRYPMACS